MPRRLRPTFFLPLTHRPDRATVSVFTAEGGGEGIDLRYKRSHFAAVLAVDGITQYDAVAFACRFLEDDALTS